MHLICSKKRNSERIACKGGYIKF